MLRSRVWLENQDFGASVGAICIIFRDLAVPTGLGEWGAGMSVNFFLNRILTQLARSLDLACAPA